MFNANDEVEVVGHHDLLLMGTRYLVRDVANGMVHLQTPGPAGWWLPSRFKLVTPAKSRVAGASMKGQAGGLKYDAGKIQWGLLLSAKGMLAAVTGVVTVLMFGAKKYAAHSWREVEDNERRYLDGLMRHYAAIMEHGLQSVDAESGLLHIDHLNCNGLFLAEIARNAKQAQ